MNGFLPLVEAFLAFALTMLALATAVSAIVGVWMRFFRWRALGLRQSVSLLYDKEIGPIFAGVKKNGECSSDRVDFIADMTFGLDLISTADKPAERDQRIVELGNSLQKSPSNLFATVLLWPWRRFQRWRSLRFGVDYLTQSQFQARLDASHVGQHLAGQFRPQEWGELRGQFERSFDEMGETATEAFARRARLRTVIVSLALAIGVNIDAFGLLNAYMTDPEIRRSVIAQQEAILAERPPATDEQGTESGQGDEKTDFDSVIDEIKERIAKAASVAEQHSKDVEALREVQTLLDSVNSDVDAIAEAKADFDDALSATRGIANQLTKSFPIGWDGYPNCYDRRLDARCALAYARTEPSRLQSTEYFDRLSAVAKADTASFVKWLLGILLSGLMVGLGAPFWVQTVNRLLKLKAYIQGEEPGGQDKGQSGAAGASSKASNQGAAGQGISRVTLSGRAVRPTGDVARKSADDWLAAQKQWSAQKRED